MVYGIYRAKTHLDLVNGWNLLGFGLAENGHVIVGDYSLIFDGESVEEISESSFIVDSGMSKNTYFEVWVLITNLPDKDNADPYTDELRIRIITKEEAEKKIAELKAKARGH